MNKTDQLLQKIVSRLNEIEKNMATKKDLKKLENKIIKKLNFVVDHFDGENIEIKQRLEKVEKRIDLFTSI